MRRTEHQHNTPQQVKSYLEQALAIVADLELTDDLRVPAFEKAVDMCASKSVTIEQIAPGGVDLAGIRHG